MELASEAEKPDPAPEVCARQSHVGEKPPGMSVGSHSTVGQAGPGGSTSGPAPAAWLLTAAVQAARPLIRVTARRTISGRSRSRTDPRAGRFTPRQVRQVIDDAFSGFRLRISDLPVEPTLGSRQNVALAALTLSFLGALETAGIERDYAIELTGDTCWRFYRQWGGLTRAASRVLTRDHVRQIQLSVDAFLTFPFGGPGYRFDDVEQVDGRSLDMRRCPVADYLGARGATDLCAGSWCNLDYALAEMWGASLDRSGTLVEGADCCDFRFRADPPVLQPGRQGAAARRVLRGRGRAFLDARRRLSARRAAWLVRDRLGEHPPSTVDVIGDAWAPEPGSASRNVLTTGPSARVRRGWPA